MLAQLGYETCGVDISVYAIKQAKNQIIGNFIVGDAQVGMPFEAKMFDLVTCFDVLEHLKWPEKALIEMFEACRGTLVCTTPNRKVERPIRKLLRDYDETHVSTKTSAAWKDLIMGDLAPKKLKVEVFYDLAVRFGGKLFFKSFSVPTIGLTVRIAVGK
jgi:2-polyprenyl-3-methyl-5-hydroxy-6-metoxy-1,4-benzoquinol methylase